MKIAKSLFNLVCLLAFLGVSPVSVTAETTKHAATQITAGTVQPSVGTLNINTASADEIAKALSGIGEKKAEEIVRYREANGPFKDKTELLKIKGIGEATLKKNESVIVL